MLKTKRMCQSMLFYMNIKRKKKKSLVICYEVDKRYAFVLINIFLIKNKRRKKKGNISMIKLI